eukprot:scaffold75920_cov54-Attheya_sp.AAC.5
MNSDPDHVSDEAYDDDEHLLKPSVCTVKSKLWDFSWILFNAQENMQEKGDHVERVTDNRDHTG